MLVGNIDDKDQVGEDNDDSENDSSTPWSFVTQKMAIVVYDTDYVGEDGEDQNDDDGEDNVDGEHNSN